MAVKVIVPSATYDEEYWGVKFNNGVGIFEDEDKARSIAKILGYKVEPLEPAEPPKKTAPRKAPTKRATKKGDE